MPSSKFSEMNLSAAIVKAVADMGFEEASQIQAAAIPEVIAGKDVIAQAQTGTGKTAAFAIPIIEKINKRKKELQAVVLCPTRELVVQVSEEFRKLLKYQEGINVTPVYGGQEISRQLQALYHQPAIIVGTPGRFMDHLRRGSIRMNTVQIVVLDEADEMLDMGFREDIEFILKDSPEDRQTVMFSATVPVEIKTLMKKYQKDAVLIDVSSNKISAPKIEQEYFEVAEHAKPEAIARIIDINSIKLAVVFCNTRSRVDNVVSNLQGRGYLAAGLHGDMSQKQRDKVMGDFRSGRAEILVATDVAGRGIDVSNIDAVFNYDFPRDDEDYVHRIGRTGRAGKSGRAFSFIVGKEAYHLKRIERTNNMIIKRGTVPTLEDFDKMLAKSQLEDITNELAAGNLQKYVALAESIMGETYTAIDVAGALLKMAFDSKKKGFDDKISMDAPRYEDRPARPSRFGGGRSGGGRSFSGNRGGGSRGNFRSSGPSRFGADRHSSGGSDRSFDGPKKSFGGAKKFDGPRKSSGSTSRFTDAGSKFGGDKYKPKGDKKRNY